MVLNSIEKLLEKYDNGETTLKEEQKLREYFTQDKVAPHLEAYKPLFIYFSKTQTEEYTREMIVETKKSTNVYRWLSVAAVLVLMVAVFAKMVNQPITIDDLSDEQYATYTQTVEAFNLLGANFTKGTDNMSALGLVGDSFNKGAENMNALNIMSESFAKGTEKMNYLGEFTNSTNKIFKSNK